VLGARGAQRIERLARAVGGRLDEHQARFAAAEVMPPASASIFFSLRPRSSMSSTSTSSLELNKEALW